MFELFKIGRHNKKASLSLSIEAIVIFVIAFVVLSLSLTLTRIIYKAAQSKIPGAVALTELESEPTAQNPITIPDTIEIKVNSKKTLNVGYYNKYPSTNSGVILDIAICIDSDKTDVGDKKPTVASIAQDVIASTSKGYKVVLTENGLTSGTYICRITATGDQLPENKDFFLEVTS